MITDQRLPLALACTGALLALTAGCNVIKPELLDDDDGVQDDGGGTTDSPTGDLDAPGSDGRPAPMPQANLVLSYGFDDPGTAVYDTSGRTMDALLSDPAAWSSMGRSGGALAMNGANPATQYVTMPSGVLDGVGDFTISLWAKLAVSAPWARIYDFGNGLPDPEARFMFMTVNGFSGTTPVGLHTTSYGGTTANEAMLSANAVLPTNVWKHIALVGTAGSRTLYVDGYPIASLTGAADVPPREMEPLAPQSWIGRSRFATDPGLNGSIDEFRIYDRILTASEIQDLAWPKQDYSYYRFDTGGGTVAADSSDRGNGGALHGTVGWTTGRLGGAIDFPGGTSGPTGPFVSMPSSPFAGCTNQLTAAAWVKLDTATPWSRVFDFGSGESTFMFLAPTDGTGVHFAMVSPAGLFDLITPAPLPSDGQWHHVAVTVNSANLAVIYVDGLPKAQASSPQVEPSDFTATTENWLGRSRFGDAVLDGAVDELRIACRAFTADEIKMLAKR